MRKILAPLFVKVLLAGVALQVLGQLIAHIPLVISRTSDPNCIDNLAACQLRTDQDLATIGYWLALASYVVFISGVLLVPLHLFRRLREHKKS